MRKSNNLHVSCGHPDCQKSTLYEVDDRREYNDLLKRYGNGKWRCVEHAQPEKVLSSDNYKTVEELHVIECRGRLYWGKEEASSGLSYGPGFRAFAKDFPPGTVLRITAEIVMPSTQPGDP